MKKTINAYIQLAVVAAVFCVICACGTKTIPNPNPKGYALTFQSMEAFLKGTGDTVRHAEGCFHFKNGDSLHFKYSKVPGFPGVVALQGPKFDTIHKQVTALSVLGDNGYYCVELMMPKPNDTEYAIGDGIVREGSNRNVNNYGFEKSPNGNGSDWSSCGLMGMRWFPLVLNYKEKGDNVFTNDQLHEAVDILQYIDSRVRKDVNSIKKNKKA